MTVFLKLLAAVCCDLFHFILEGNVLAEMLMPTTFQTTVILYRVKKESMADNVQNKTKFIL